MSTNTSSNNVIDPNVNNSNNSNSFNTHYRKSSNNSSINLTPKHPIVPNASSNNNSRNNTLTDSHIRQLIATKQSELNDISLYQLNSVQGRIQELSNELINEKQKYETLKTDFEYNLKLLQDRDNELNQYDQTFKQSEALLNQKEQLINQLKLQIIDHDLTVLNIKTDHSNTTQQLLHKISELKRDNENKIFQYENDLKTKSLTIDQLNKQIQTLTKQQVTIENKAKSEVAELYDKRLADFQSDYNKEINELTNTINELSIKYENCENKLQNEIRAKQQIETVNNQLEANINNLNLQLNSINNKHKLELQDRDSLINELKSSNQNKLIHYENQINQYIQQLKEYDQQFNQLKYEYENNRKHEMSEFENIKNELILKYENNIDNLNIQINEKNGNIDTNNAVINKLQSDINNLNNQIELIKQSYDNIIETQNESNINKLNEKQSIIDNCNREINSLRDKLSNNTNNIDERRKEIIALKSTNNQLELLIQQLKRDKSIEAIEFDKSLELEKDKYNELNINFNEKQQHISLLERDNNRLQNELLEQKSLLINVEQQLEQARNLILSLQQEQSVITHQKLALQEQNYMHNMQQALIHSGYTYNYNTKQWEYKSDVNPNNNQQNNINQDKSLQQESTINDNNDSNNNTNTNKLNKPHINRLSINVDSGNSPTTTNKGVKALTLSVTDDNYNELPVVPSPRGTINRRQSQPIQSITKHRSASRNSLEIDFNAANDSIQQQQTNKYIQNDTHQPTSNAIMSANNNNNNSNDNDNNNTSNSGDHGRRISRVPEPINIDSSDHFHNQLVPELVESIVRPQIQTARLYTPVFSDDLGPVSIPNSPAPSDQSKPQNQQYQPQNIQQLTQQHNQQPIRHQPQQHPKSANSIVSFKVDDNIQYEENAINSKYNTLTNENNLLDENKRLKLRVQELESQNNAIRNVITEMKQELESMAESAATEQTPIEYKFQLESQATQIKQQAKQIQLLNNDVTKLQQHNALLIAQNESLQTHVKPDNNNNNNKSANQSKLNQQIQSELKFLRSYTRELNQTINNLKTELLYSLTQKQELEKQLQSKQSQLQLVSDDPLINTEKIFELEKANNELKHKFEAAQQHLKQLLTEREKLMNITSELKADLNRLNRLGLTHIPNISHKAITNTDNMTQSELDSDTHKQQRLAPYHATQVDQYRSPNKIKKQKEDRKDSPHMQSPPISMLSTNVDNELPIAPLVVPNNNNINKSYLDHLERVEQQIHDLIKQNKSITKQIQQQLPINNTDVVNTNSDNELTNQESNNSDNNNSDANNNVNSVSTRPNTHRKSRASNTPNRENNNNNSGSAIDNNALNSLSRYAKRENEIRELALKGSQVPIIPRPQPLSIEEKSKLTSKKSNNNNDVIDDNNKPMRKGSNKNKKQNKMLVDNATLSTNSARIRNYAMHSTDNNNTHNHNQQTQSD